MYESNYITTEMLKFHRQQATLNQILSQLMQMKQLQHY